MGCHGIIDENLGFGSVLNRNNNNNNNNFNNSNNNNIGGNSSYQGVIPSNGYFKGKKLCGKVMVVDIYPDFKVQVVNYLPDLRVEKVNHFTDTIGQWQFVDRFPDFTIQYVDSFPDFKIQFVDNNPGVS